MQSLPPAFAPLAAYRQFIVCQLVPDADKPGKTHKYPIDIQTGHKHDAHAVSIWLDCDTAIRTAAAWGAGYCVGFVFTEHDPFFFIDVDNCLTTDGQWTPIVAELSAALPGAAWEISQSGRGLHVFGYGRAPTDRRKKDYTNKLFDLYTELRFVALTGVGVVGDMAAADHTAGLHALADKWLKRIQGQHGQEAEWTDGPRDGWNGPADDAELIRRAMQSHSTRAAFGQAAAFADLWQCNVDVLAVAYPPDGNGTLPYDASRADAALAQHLAFWTGADCERIRRLMAASGLVRDKWERESYILGTILRAAALQVDVLRDKLPEPLAGTAPALATPGAAAAPAATPVQGVTVMDPAAQVGLFHGCTYILDQHRVLTPGGVTLKPDQFRVAYGGYTCVMDLEGKRSSRDSWEVFTQSQALRFPRADSSCFRPELVAGAIIDYNGQRKVNLWWPVETARQVGDPAPFLRHLAALLPDERDRTILLSYMAAVVQYKGYKFQWCPLIQGAEGNGKTLLTRCVAFAIGDRHTYFPKASQIAKNFNGWQYGTIFAGIEDIYVGEGKEHVMEELKPMVTGDKNEVESKGVDQIQRELCFNLMLNSNHKDALRKHRNDRRFAMFYTAQQTAADILEWGMGGEYFPRLYAWLRAGGYEIVNELLHTYPIPAEFNPCVQVGGLAQRAPLTSSYEAAISANLGSVEQEVLEAIEQGKPGFAGGWVSSAAFDNLIASMNKGNRYPRNKRREVLVSLGYDWHPALVAGRVNNVVMPDACKPHLFIQQDHPARAILNAAEVARAYTLAQAPALIHIS